MQKIDFDKLIEPITKMYQNLEYELVVKIATHFKLYEPIGFANSMKWYASKVAELGGLTQEAVDIISKQTKIPKKKIVELLKEAGLSTINQDEIKKANATGKYHINVEKLKSSSNFNDIVNNSYTEIDDILKLINTKALNAANEEYMNVLNTAYTEVRTGIDYNTAIRKALSQMAKNGVKVVSYKQKSGKVINYGIESCVRRDVLTAVVQATNRASTNFCKEAGYEYYAVSHHLGARVTNTHDYKDHSWWQGKVYKIEGSTEEYPNFQETCNEGDVQGFGGANCRHLKFGYIPGVSVLPKPISEEENAKQYQAEQTKRSYERKIRELKRQCGSAKASNDTEEYKKYKDKLVSVDNEYNEFLKNNGLKRSYSREYATSISKNIGELSRDSSAIGDAKPTKILVENINSKDFKEELLKYENLIYKNDTESAIMIEETGDVFRFDGTDDYVTIEGNFKNALITHNHPSYKDEIGGSFGKDDFKLLVNHQDIKELRAVDEKYCYSMKALKQLKEKDYDDAYINAMLVDDDYKHCVMLQLKERGLIQYERNVRERT